MSTKDIILTCAATPGIIVPPLLVLWVRRTVKNASRY